MFSLGGDSSTGIEECIGGGGLSTEVTLPGGGDGPPGESVEPLRGGADWEIGAGRPGVAEGVERTSREASTIGKNNSETSESPATTAKTRASNRTLAAVLRSHFIQAYWPRFSDNPHPSAGERTGSSDAAPSTEREASPAQSCGVSESLLPSISVSS